ncbi:hypothetical protein A2U01_0073168, partial [Trifolium medium]|nr:hypothetical protein [Trifolium medium]
MGRTPWPRGWWYLIVSQVHKIIIASSKDSPAI